jgi:acid phosphatase family membrane protein YuiD
LSLAVLSESVGFPSLHAAVMSCLTTLLGLRAGWGAAETSLALVVTVIVIHDAVRFKASAQAQRAVLSWLVLHLEEERRFQRPAANLSRVWSHRPFHVASGVVFGLGFALACGSGH